MDYGGDEVWPWPQCGHRLHRDCHLALMAAASNPRCPQCRIDQDGHLARTRCEHNRWDFCDQGAVRFAGMVTGMTAATA